MSSVQGITAHCVSSFYISTQQEANLSVPHCHVLFYCQMSVALKHTGKQGATEIRMLNIMLILGLIKGLLLDIRIGENSIRDARTPQPGEIFLTP